MLLVAERGGGPTEAFCAAFLTGKDAAGRERAIGLEALPDVLANLDETAAILTVEQIRALAPATLAFPELQTGLDADIIRQLSTKPPLNLDERGWGLRYCRGLHGAEDFDLFTTADELERLGAVRDGVRWKASSGQEWWPLVDGQLIYNLEFPASEASPQLWVSEESLRDYGKFSLSNGKVVFDHFRVGWRDVARATDERSAIASVLPPRTAELVTTHTVWGGLLDEDSSVALAALMCSFVFDYLVRLGGKTHLSIAVVNAVPAPSRNQLERVVGLGRTVLAQSPELSNLAPSRLSGMSSLEIGELRALIDGEIAVAYGVSMEQFAAIFASFPNVDRSQPMLPGEPKCFVTRDLALRAFCDITGSKKPDIATLMREIGSGLPDPRADFRDLDARISTYAEIGAVPYRPSPKGARIPTDPSIVDDVLAILSDDAQSSGEIAEGLGEDEELVGKILKNLRKSGDVYVEGRGKKARYYVVGKE